MSTETIYNYRRADDQTITGGQPDAAQLAAAAAEGVRAVINLAPDDPERSLPDEAGLVQSLGMAYYHVPVDWNAPREEDYAAFEAAMAARPPGRVLIHCAANYRATAFFALYAMRQRGWSAAEAEAFRASVWRGSDYPVWEAFIARMRARIEGLGAAGEA